MNPTATRKPPVKPPRKAKKEKKGSVANKISTIYSKGDKFIPKMKWDNRWDKKTKDAYSTAKWKYGEKHPTFTIRQSREEDEASAVAQQAQQNIGCTGVQKLTHENCSRECEIEIN